MQKTLINTNHCALKPITILIQKWNQACYLFHTKICCTTYTLQNCQRKSSMRFKNKNEAYIENLESLTTTKMFGVCKNDLKRNIYFPPIHSPNCNVLVWITYKNIAKVNTTAQVFEKQFILHYDFQNNMHDRMIHTSLWHF